MNPPISEAERLKRRQIFDEYLNRDGPVYDETVKTPQSIRGGGQGYRRGGQRLQEDRFAHQPRQEQREDYARHEYETRRGGHQVPAQRPQEKRLAGRPPYTRGGAGARLFEGHRAGYV